MLLAVLKIHDNKIVAREARLFGFCLVSRAYLAFLVAFLLVSSETLLGFIEPWMRSGNAASDWSAVMSDCVTTNRTLSKLRNLN